MTRARSCFRNGTTGAGLFGLPALFLTAMLAAYAAPEAQKLVLTGSSTIAPLAAELGQRFEALRPGVEVDVQSGGSSRGIHDAREGLADLGMVSRALTAEEADLHAYTIALDGVALITHHSNPVAALNRAEIIAIYTGRINRWSEIGGPDRPITVVNKAEGNVVEVLDSLFAPVRTLTANIALEMAYASGWHQRALFMSGLCLLMVTMVLVGLTQGLRKRA